MVSERVGSAYETVAKKKRRDGIRRLLEAGAISTGLKVTGPLPHIAIERLCENYLRIATRDSLRHSDRVSVYEYSQPDSCGFEIPETPSRIPDTLEATRGTVEWRQPFVAVVPDATLIGHSALGYSDATGVLLETAIAQRRILERDLVKHPLSVARLLASERGRRVRPQAAYGEVCPLVSLYSNYYHWLQNTLPRLQGIREYERRTGRKPKLLIRSDPPSWLLESLSLLGFDEDRILEWNHKVATVERLVVPTLRRQEFQYPRREYTHLGTGYRSLAIPPTACKWLQDAATGGISDEGYDTDSTRRVYISRDDAHKRRVHNETELLDFLEERGFERYVLSDLSFPEQVALFETAETVVAPHGAGLANIVFGTECRVIELAPAPLRPTFYMLATAMGFEYSFLHCESSGRDIVVDTDELATVLGDC